MGEASPFVKEGWRGSNCSIRSCREARAQGVGKSTLRKVNRAVHSAAEQSEDHGAQGPAGRFLPAGSGITSIKFLCTQSYTGLVAKHQFPRAKLLRGLYSIKARHKRQQWPLLLLFYKKGSKFRAKVGMCSALQDAVLPKKSITQKSIEQWSPVHMNHQDAHEAILLLQSRDPQWCSLHLSRKEAAAGNTGRWVLVNTAS